MATRTPQQRSDAARKAAASRAANRLNGTTSHKPAKANGAARGPAFPTPKPNYRALRLAALVALEAAFVQKLTDAGVTQDDRDAYAKYKKLKALALSPATTPALQNESDSALRMATLHLVRLF